MVRKYGITHEDFDRIWNEQEGKCAICGSPMKSEDSGSMDAVIDHNHKTSKVRGLLHKKHNCLLGFADDDPEILMAAAKYLLKTSDL